MWSLILLCVFLMYCFVKRKSFKPHLYPPGPLSLPIIGNLLSVWVELKKLKYHHCVWQAWSQKYGDIVGLQLGFTKVVVVSGKDLIKEVSNREVFEGRPDGFMYLMRSFGKKMGIVFADGKSWQATRRVVLKCLKNFGYGTSSMEAYIAEEAVALVNLRIEDEQKPVLVNHMFDVSIINVLWRLVAGKRYDLKDRRLLDLCEMISRTFKIVDMSGGLLTFMPFLRHIIPGLIGYTEFRDINIRLYSFLKKVIDQHRTSVDMNNPRDVIDAFLIEMMENKNEAFTDEELQVVCLDLLESGTETVSNSSVFMILHLVREQDVQRKVQQEIDDTIGHARSPTLSDRNKMVYTEAVLMEVLRISSVAPVGIPHMALENARLGDYVIPKGTFVLLAMHDLHNGRHWKDPNAFRPERFLTKDGNLIQDEWLMPFGTGKRRCIGEGLARSELFMFMTHLLQKFNICVPDGDPMPSTEIVNGLTLSTKPFHVVFKQRF